MLNQLNPMKSGYFFKPCYIIPIWDIVFFSLLFLCLFCLFFLECTKVIGYYLNHEPILRWVTLIIGNCTCWGSMLKSDRGDFWMNKGFMYIWGNSLSLSLSDLSTITNQFPIQIQIQSIYPSRSRHVCICSIHTYIHVYAPGI
jgi:hypothetical protein